MKKYKVLISANVLFTITNFRKNLIRFLIEKKIEIICVANVDDLSTDSQTFLEQYQIKFIKVDISRKGINPIEDLRYLFQLVKIYRKEKPDVIMHFTIKPNIYGTIASKLVGCASLNTINGLGSALIHDNFLSKILKYMYKFSLQFSKKVYFQNNDDLNFFISNGLISTVKSAIVPGSGVNTQSFEKTVRKDKSTLTFLLVSRLLRDKGIYEYINAIKYLKEKKYNCKFLIGGQLDEGNPSSISENKILEWRNEGLIEYIGKTDDIKEFFRLADIVVLPSYREGLSRFLIEAASSYKPIITTDVPGCKEVVDEAENGYLCQVKDYMSLARSIEKMISLSNTEIDSMGKKSNKIAVQRFDSKIVNEIYYKGIQQI